MSATARTTGRAAPVLAWSLFGCFLLLVAATFAVLLDGGGGDEGVLVVLVTGFAVVGALIASRQPHNSVGWLLLAVALALGLQSVVAAYVRQADRPGAVAMAWVDGWIWFVWLTLAGIFLPLVFPTGRLLSRRWRWAVGLGVCALVASVIGAAFTAGPLDAGTPKPVRNPLGASGAWGELVAAVGIVGDVLAALGFLLAMLTLVLRLRRSSGVERQQLKTFGYVVSLAIVGLVVASAAEFAGSDSASWVYVVGATGWFVALFLIVVGIPAAVGIAILRHRLYDIDVVIKRTLVYGSLTAMLALSYLGLVLLFRLVLAPLTDGSDLAVAGSTLAVAALFRPLRSRIQAIVDRRFFRARYDAAQTLHGFAGRLRDELDLETLGVDLRQAVRDTMAPSHVSLWLREVPR
jgi:hypothetical protein